ncbi:DUF732 domain-containing protein [Mycobacterium colombiense]
MSDDETQMAPTAGAMNAAWSQEPEPLPWSRWRYRFDRRIALAAGGVLLAIAVAAAVLVALSWPAPQDAAINPAPMRQPIPTVVQPGPAADRQLLDALKRDGITVTDGPLLIKRGRDACRRMESGQLRVRDWIDQIAAWYPSLGYELSAKSVYDGIDSYCPELDAAGGP